MRFLQPTVDFEGIISQEGTISAGNHVITREWAEANLMQGIHSDSANYAELVTVNGEQKLKLKPLTISDVQVDTTAASLAAFISSNYSNGNEFQEGDIIILTGTGSTRPETYIHNGGSAGSSADWTDIQGADVQASEVRGFLSGQNGVDYSSANGQISLNQGFTRGLFGVSGSGLSYNSANGQYSLSADTDDISEGANKYFTDTRARDALSAATGALLSYDPSTGEIDLQNSDVRGALAADPAAGNLLSYNSSTGEMLVAQSSVRGAVSAGGALSYNSSTGVFEITDATIRSKISVASGALVSYDQSTGEIDLQNSDVRGALSADPAAGNLLSYNNGTGEMLVAQSSVRGAVSAGGALSYNSGSGVFEITDATIRSKMSEATGSLVSYDQGTGEIDMQKSAIRKEIASQSLSAGTFSTITHNLGSKLVHVSAMDNQSKLVDLEVEYIDANSLKVKSAIDISVDMAISL